MCIESKPGEINNMICIRCGRNLPHDLSNFYSYSYDKTVPRTTCKQCCIDKSKLQYASKPNIPKLVSIDGYSIRERRLELGLSAIQLSRIVNISYTTLHRMEIGEVKKTKLETCLKLEKELNLKMKGSI